MITVNQQLATNTLALEVLISVKLANFKCINYVHAHIHPLSVTDIHTYIWHTNIYFSYPICISHKCIYTGTCSLCAHIYTHIHWNTHPLCKQKSPDATNVLHVRIKAQLV